MQAVLPSGRSHSTCSTAVPHGAPARAEHQALGGHESTLQTDQFIPKPNPTGCAGQAKHQSELVCAEANPQPQSCCFKLKLLLPVNPYME